MRQHGGTALMLAAEKGHIEMVTMLLDAKVAVNMAHNVSDKHHQIELESN